MWIGAGSRHETDNIAGVSHFIEHLLFKGTKTLSARDISQAIEGRGGYLNAFTQEESTCFFVRVACEQIWKAVDILTDMYLNPRFSREDIDKERRVILEEIMMYRDQPQHVVHEMLVKSLWKGHHLGRPVIGFEKTVGGMSRKDIRGYKSRMYVNRNTVFAFAGSVDHDKCVEKIQGIMGKVKSRIVPKVKLVGKGVGQDHVVCEQKKIEQTQLAMGIRLFGKRDKRRYALKVMSAVLGENMSSRLFQIVREKNGLAYSIHSGSQLLADTGVLVISAGLDRKRTDKALELIVKELARLKKQSIGKKELNRAKDYVTGQMKLGMESTSSQMIYAGESIISLGRLISPEEVMAKIRAVSSDDILSLANTVFKKGKTSLCVISPDITDRTAGDFRDTLGGM